MNADERHSQAWKKLEIFSLPPVLIIHLKRFRSNGAYRVKIVSPVSFPLRGLGEMLRSQ